jgi:hypothetical protein
MFRLLCGLCVVLLATLQARAASADELSQRAVERRAVEAAIWGIPAVNYDLMLQEAKKVGGKANEIVYWGRPLDWHNQTLTPNPDAIYLMAFYDTKAVGPVVIEVPPAEGGSLNANIVNVWQMALEDAGLLGADKGKGGKYLLLPPGYAGKVPDGYIPLQSDTYGGYALLRSNLKSHADADVAASVAYGKRIKIYPLSQAAEPPPTKFIDAQNALFDSTIRYDLSFFDGLNRVVQSEPWLDRDRAMIDQLRTLGIEKGKAFKPDDKTKAALTQGIEEAKAFMEAKYEAGLPPYWEGGHWTYPAFADFSKVAQAGYTDPDDYPIDERGTTYSYAYVGIKRLGAGQFYLIDIRDKDGRDFNGGSTYRLTVPANVPVQQYWSVTAYDRETHALIRNMPRASRSSQIAEMARNADGSVDIFFGPKAPDGKEANWVPTDAARKFELMFRLYGPTKALFDKTWRLPDVEKVADGLSIVDTASGAAVPVTADNFPRAESDLYFSAIAKRGGLGGFEHNRQSQPIDAQTVIRLNRDTLYSGAVFDLDAGPIAITLPDPGKRFLSMQVIDEDQYTPYVFYGGGKHTFTKEQIGTRYVAMALRILVDPSKPGDFDEVHKLQDAIKVEQPGGPGKFEIPNWDPVSQKKVRDALLVLASTLPDTNRMFGTKEEVDPARRLIGSASAWGGNPQKDATYLNVTPPNNDGRIIYRLNVKDVPVDAFWSVSLYNAKGYYEANPYNAYSLNSLTALKEPDGGVAIQFGGCDGKLPNCLPTMPGWNYMVRLYRPRAEVLDGTWTFPTAQPIN